MKKFAKFLLASLVVSSIVLGGCDKQVDPPKEECSNHYDSNLDGKCDYCGIKMPQETQEFKGLTFKNKTFTYDGKEHSIYVNGVPEFATVEYYNNTKIELGTYPVTATVKANGYKTKKLDAKLIIIGLSFEGITFNDATFNYDGEEHSIEVEGLPEFASVEYRGNGKTEIGTYTVYATVTADHYETLDLKAKLTIKGKEFTGITFKDKEFAYDGKWHSIYVEGAPDFATVTYDRQNDQYKEGTYTVTATITAEGYETLVLTAKLIISKKLPDAELLDRTLIYTGEDQRIVFELPDDLPTYTEETYKVDGKTVEEGDFKVKTLGEHTASITLTNTYWGYKASTVTAKITVIENNIGGVDSTKTPLTIDENLKYQTLRSKILEGNFTIKEEYIDDYYYPDGTEKHELDSVKYTFVANNEIFEIFSYVEYSELVCMQTHYRHTKLIGDKVRSVYFQDGILDSGWYESSYEMDGSLFYENDIARTGLKAMAILKEADDGGFENSVEGAYANNYGSFEIDSVNNEFVHDVVAHYYKLEWQHDEHSRYTIYNIGNTTINVPDVFNASKIEGDFRVLNTHYVDGFYYTYYSDNSVEYYSLDPVLDAISVVYLADGEYTLPTHINNIPVLDLEAGFYDHLANNDCSGYTFKVYFDNSGCYQGEYESLGKISGFSEIYKLIEDGANVLFYDDWH